MSQKNPFEHTPENLNPKDAEFLKKHADVDSSDLMDLELHKKPLAQKQEPLATPQEEIPEFTTDEEKENYLNELVDLGSLKVARRDFLCVKPFLEKLYPLLYEFDVSAIGRITAIKLYGIDLNLVHGISLPNELQTLDMSDCHSGNTVDIQLPESLITLSLRGDNLTSIDNLYLSSNLETLALTRNPLQSIDNVKFPKSLKLLLILDTSISTINNQSISFLKLQCGITRTPLAADTRELAKIKEKYPHTQFIM